MRSKTLFILFLLVAVLLSSCGAAPAGSPSATADKSGATPTMDLCAPEHIKDAATAVHRLMRAFDDSAQIAQNSAREQLTAPITGLQAVRRQSEDLQVPACLTTLKNLQLAYMNAVITTLISFVGGAKADALNSEITLARNNRTAYNAELERLLGVTLTPAPTLPPLPTSAHTPVPPTATPAK
jgi:hypothetical protein